MCPHSRFWGSGISKITAFFCPSSTAAKDFFEEILVQENICQNHSLGNHPFANPRIWTLFCPCLLACLALRLCLVLSVLTFSCVCVCVSLLLISLTSQWSLLSTSSAVSLWLCILCSLRSSLSISLAVSSSVSVCVYLCLSPSPSPSLSPSLYLFLSVPLSTFLSFCLCPYFRVFLFVELH